ncbi:MAG: GTPase [Xanthomonadales bacterium]|nr:GTPase [Xanthomonadales bacterium]
MLAAALVVVAVVALALLLLVTDTALSVWERLAAAPAWVRFGWIAVVSAVTVGCTLLAWRWLRPQPGDRPAEAESTPDLEQLENALAEAQADGIDVAEALAELAEQKRRRDGGAITLAVFGEVSAGKSALVRALVPDADAPSDARAGTTTQIRHHRWVSETGDEIVIADLPGFNLGQDQRLLEEARRAHVVVFLTDGDLTASQFAELEQLVSLDKPVILALNKIDRYAAEEQRALRARLAEQTGLPSGRIVAIRSGGREEVIRLLEDGRETRETRERSADVEPLRRAIQGELDRNAALMDSLQETAVLLLAAEKLDRARHAHRAEQAEALVSTYSRRAVVGALAAVAPGSDLVIQGVLATRLIQELCAVYDVSVKDVEIESFLKLAGGRVRKMSALTLAIGGNALKAFPGLGTLTGGLLHAVAYGMIFDSLGRAASDTLATRGDLRALPAARAFEENLTDALENHAGRFARMALREARDIDAS